MSSLRRLPSFDCAEHASPALSSPSRNLSRNLSLPAFSFSRRRQGLPHLPFYGRRSPGTPFRPPSCSHWHDEGHRRLTSCRSMPADHEKDRAARSAARSVSRGEAFGVEDSVVYKDLCESVHLQAPGRNGCEVGSEGTLQSADLLGIHRFQADKSVESSSLGVPMSLRMLKRRLTAKSEANRQNSFVKLSKAVDSDEVLADNLLSHGFVDSAFGMLIFMMESLQNHALRFRNAFVNEADAHFQMMMQRVRQEMQDTFLWLFQRVFACTPKLMLLTMMLLADFAAHSMGGHIALAVPPLGEPPTYVIERSVSDSALSFDLRKAASDKLTTGNASRWNGLQRGVELSSSEDGGGGGVARALKVGGGMDGGTSSSNLFSDRAAITPQEETHTKVNDVSSAGLDNDSKPEENQIFSAMWRQALSDEQISDPLKSSTHILVAPVCAPALEADDYTCFDRTDLSYQHELIRDPSNPLLLANYAQFQHVVRHDHSRANELYKRAVKADPVDGELMGKYANFLWVAKEDVEAADEAYKAALATDPTNAYHAGSYAHFLWNSGVDQDNMCSPSIIQCEIPAS